MTINLNKQLVTKDGLLEYIQDIDVYNFYIGGKISLTHNILSPLRKERNASFGFFKGNSGEICFRDFVLGSGDFVKFVQMKFNLNYFEALSKIALDLNLDDNFHIKSVSKTVSTDSPTQNRDSLLNEVTQLSLGKKRRDWKAYDFAYWLQFGINYETLIKYRVEPIQYVFVNGTPIFTSKYSYAYLENKDGEETYKIYQPYNEDFKWLNNHNESIWQGWEQLPKNGEDLIITKSLKDVMAIDTIINIPAVSLQAESVKPKEHIIAELKSRFTNIYLLYDNDYDKETNWGRKFGTELSNEFDLVRLEIHETYESKDFSDLVKNKGEIEAKDILNSMIDMPF